MSSFLDSIYFKVRKDEIERCKRKLSKLKVNTIYLCITKNCWKYNIQYELILKDKDSVILKLKGYEKTILLEYHKADMIFCREYYKFLNMMIMNKIDNGIYITNGVFENKILQKNKISLFNKKIKFEDGMHFLRGQLGFKFTVLDVFKKKRLNFYKYLPS